MNSDFLSMDVQCQHPEAAKFLDDREGTQVCMDCGLVLDDFFSPQEFGGGPILSDEESRLHKLNLKVRCMGLRACPQKQGHILQDWVANGHLPPNIIPRVWHLSRKALEDLVIESISPKDRIYFSFEEFSAHMLYQFFCREKTPRSLQSISLLTGVSEKKLWKLEKIFPSCFILDNMRASCWMVGISLFLPMNYKESVHVSGIADMLQNDFALNPLSILSVAIYAYLIQRKKTFLGRGPSPPIMSKVALGKLVGVSTGTITKGYKSLILENDKIDMNVLNFVQPEKC